MGSKNISLPHEVCAWWPQRDSNPRLGLERASPWVVISRTSTPGATARCHSRRGIVPRIHLLFVDLSWSTKSRAIPKSRFVRSAAAYPQRHAEGPVGQSWSRAELTTLGCCDGEPSRKPSADRRFAEAFRSQAKTLRPETGSTGEFMVAQSVAVIAGSRRWNAGRPVEGRFIRSWLWLEVDAGCSQ